MFRLGRVMSLRSPFSGDGRLAWVSVREGRRTMLQSRRGREGRPHDEEVVERVPERYVVFKGEDMPDELDEDVGPVIVVHSDEARNYEERGWMSRSQARQLAADLGYELEIDGPSDEELELLRRGEEPADTDDVPF